MRRLWQSRRTPASDERPLAYQVIPRDHVTSHAMYALLDELVQAHHEELREARIALAWALRWKPDTDGITKLGQCKKASELDRQLHDFDFVILLKRSFWIDERVTDEQRAALLDHELCHGRLQRDRETNLPKRDGAGRLLYRIRKHDVEEFREIVERHGTWKGDLEAFAGSLRRAPPRFVPCEACRDGDPGWQRVTDAQGIPRLARCACYTAWAAHRQALSASA